MNLYQESQFNMFVSNTREDGGELNWTAEL